MANKNKVLNTFTKGLDTDTSVNKYDNSNYYSATNFRLTTNNSLDNMSLSNVPDAVELISDIGIATEGYIVGTEVIRDDTIVIFFQNDTTGDSEIYKSDYPLSTLDLVYTDKDSTSKLNFSINNPIQSISRYESSTLQKVYWCDGIEENRYINIVEDYEVSPGVYAEATLLSWNPSVNLNNPVITSVTTGGNLLSGRISYVYQLYKQFGNESAVSATSTSVPLTSRLGKPFQDFRGDEVGVNTGNAVRLTFQNLDDNFNRIRIYSIHYDDGNANPTINVINESSYSGTTFTYTDGGNTSLQSVSLEEFRLLVGRTVVSKTLASKKNYLFAGNITQAAKNVDFDARSYRFPSSTNNTYIYDGAGNEYRINSSYQIYEENTVPVTPYDIPEDHDAINYLNDFDRDQATTSSSNTPSTHPYEFQISSTTPGGSGPNVSYTFTSQSISAGISTNNTIRTIGNFSTNPINTAHYTGYKRGEVYRFGIEFIFKNGEKSFVKWIGDIRFPGVNNNSYPLSSVSGLSLSTTQLGITFDINFSSIPQATLDELSGYKIVRVKREDTDKNILYQGIGGSFVEHQDYLGTGGSNPDVWAGYSRIPTTNDYNTLTILNADKDFLYSPVHPTQTINGTLLEVNSPELAFNNDITYNSGDRIYAVGTMEEDPVRQSGAFNGTPAPAIYDRRRNYDFATTNTMKRISTLDDFRYSEQREPGDSAIDTFDGRTIAHRISPRGAAGGGQQTFSDSYRGKCGYLGLLANIDLTGVTIPVSDREVFILEHIRTRFESQYGGNTYSARSNNTYIPTVLDTTDTFVSLDGYAGGTNSHNVYGGDTFTTIFDYLRTYFDVDILVSAPAVIADSAEEYIAFPVETTINSEYRRDELVGLYTSAADYAGGSYTLCESEQLGIIKYPGTYPSDATDLYLYNDAYSRENDAQIATAEPFDFVTQELFDTKVVSSDKKFNGEQTDSWTKLNLDNFLEVESDKGPISRLINYNDNLFYFQNNGHGIIAVEDRIQQDNLTLGTGPNLERFDYLSNEFGAQRANAVISTPNNLYFIDEHDYSLRVPSRKDTEGNLSKLKGISNLIKTKYSETLWMQLGYDPEYKEVLFCTESGALVYNELLNSFTGEYEYTANQGRTPAAPLVVGGFEEINGKLYTIGFDRFDDSLKISQLNAATTPLGDYSEVTILIHPKGDDVFTFDVLDLRTRSFDDMTQSLPIDSDVNTDTLSRITYQNSYIPSTQVPIVVDGNISKLARVLRHKIPVTSNLKRYVDVYLLATLRFDNTTGHKYMLHDVTSYVRPTKT